VCLLLSAPLRRYAPETVTVTVVNGETVDLDIQLLEEEGEERKKPTTTTRSQ
jgi:hypothetical protein